MRLNTKCSIALHCLVFISEYQHKIKVTSELLAKSTGCNPAAIRSILNSLQKAQIISVVRGIGGAYLNADPCTLTIWDIYYAIEPDGLNHLIGIHPHPSKCCPVGMHIHEALKASYQEIGETVQKAMQEITLQQVMNTFHQKSD